MTAPKHPHPELFARISSLYQAGVSRKDIKATFRCSGDTITAAIKANGVAMRNVRPTPEQQAEVVQLYTSGVARKEIVASTGIPNATLTHILKRHGIDGRKSEVAPEVLDAICDLYLEGKSYTQIAEALGVTHGTVAGLIHRKQLKRPEVMNIANRRAMSRGTKTQRPNLRVVASNPSPRPRRRPKWAGAPIRGIHMTPRKLRYISQFLRADWQLETVADLFDVSPEAITDALAQREAC